MCAGTSIAHVIIITGGLNGQLFVARQLLYTFKPEYMWHLE